ncbi:hypothetical protein CsatB_000935 [Cannabis sativa]
MFEALKKRMGGSFGASPPAKKSKGGEGSSTKEKRSTGEVIDLSKELTAANPSTPKVAKSKESGPPKVGSELVRSDPERVRAPTPPLPVLLEAKKGKEMLAHYMNRLVHKVSEQLAGADNDSSLELLVGGVLKEFTRVGLKLAYTYSWAKSATSKNTDLSDTLKAEADLARKDAEEARAEVRAVRLELGEANKKLFTAQKKITVLTKDLEAADHFEETIETLSGEVNSLQDERTSLRAVLHRMKEEKEAKEGELSAEVDRLKEKVNALETANLELFFDFWKANPQANYDYLGDAKDMYLEFCASQVAYGETEAAASTSRQAADAPPVQTTDPPALVGPEEPNQELGTPAA